MCVVYSRNRKKSESTPTKTKYEGKCNSHVLSVVPINEVGTAPPKAKVNTWLLIVYADGSRKSLLAMA